MGMSWSEEDQRFMREALAEAKIAASVNEVPVGAIVVKAGEIIARGLNRPIQDSDPTAHAEVVAIRAAAQREQNYRLIGTTVYVTLEPCAMCMGAMLNARVSRLVFGAYDAKAGAAGSVIDLSDNRKLNHRLEVNGGLLEDKSAALLQKFFESRRSGNGTGSN
jgi:tRNA(adenine34) deaminase